MDEGREFLGGPLRGAKLKWELPSREYPDVIHCEYLACGIPENAEAAGILYAAGATGLAAEYEFNPDNGTYEFLQWTRRLAPDTARPD
jgi:hypothetical protein